MKTRIVKKNSMKRYMALLNHIYDNKVVSINNLIKEYRVGIYFQNACVDLGYVKKIARGMYECVLTEQPTRAHALQIKKYMHKRTNHKHNLSAANEPTIFDNVVNESHDKTSVKYYYALLDLCNNKWTGNTVQFVTKHKISGAFCATAKRLGYINEDLQYIKGHIPTIKDAEIILNHIAINTRKYNSQRKYNRQKSKPTTVVHEHHQQSLPQPVVKKTVKKEKEPNVWMYIAVISMFTTLVTMALMLLR